jgi:hypothetical protein
MEQMSPFTPGHQRRGLRTPQILHFKGGTASRPHRIIGVMARTDLYLKLELDHEPDEKPERLASEICRQLMKMYGVRTAEVSNLITRQE